MPADRLSEIEQAARLWVAMGGDSTGCDLLWLASILRELVDAPCQCEYLGIPPLSEPCWPCRVRARVEEGR